MGNVRAATFLASVLSCALALAGPAQVEISPAADKSRVPEWDARGLGPLPWQGAACLDVSADGRFVAAGTIAPAGDPNLFLLDENGKAVQQLRAGQRWLGEVTVSGDGRFVSAVSTTPEGTAGDFPRVYGFRQGKELAQVGGKFRFHDFRASAFLFHYGNHSNHLPRLTAWAGEQWVIVGDDVLWWLSPGENLAESVHLGQGMTTAFAASASGRAAVGRAAGVEQDAGKFSSLIVVERGKPKPLWSRALSTDAAPSPNRRKASMGPLRRPAAT